MPPTENVANLCKVFTSVAHQQVEPISGTTNIAVNLHPPNSPNLTLVSANEIAAISAPFPGYP